MCPNVFKYMQPQHMLKALVVKTINIPVVNYTQCILHRVYCGLFEKYNWTMWRSHEKKCLLLLNYAQCKGME